MRKPGNPSFLFSVEVSDVLTEAGWHPDRTVELVVPHLANARPSVWAPPVREFLREFGGLTVYFIRRDDSIASLHFDVVRANFHTAAYAIGVKEYAERAREPHLHVIGEAYAENLLLLMSDTGQVYGAYQECLYYIAGSGRAAIEAICLDLPFREIP